MKPETRRTLGFAAQLVASALDPKAGERIAAVRQAGERARAKQGVVIDVSPGSYRVR